MIYLVIGLFIAVAVGAFFRQQSKQPSPENTADSKTSPEESQAQSSNPESLDLPDVEIMQEDESDSGFVLSAKPVTDPELAAGATYSSHAPAGEDS
ncbi:MAG: hypothetical protein IJQ08_10615, partial [Synergistaceae bacterium]|nr:hypothetical protein [Synergistaceae bacterium]